VFEELGSRRIVRWQLRSSFEEVVRRKMAERLQRPREGQVTGLGPEGQAPHVLVFSARQATEPSRRNRVGLAGKDQLADLLQAEIPRNRQMNEQLSVPLRQNDRTTIALFRTRHLLLDQPHLF